MNTLTKINYFFVNHLPTELVLKQGYYNIPPKGHARITKYDLEEESILYALGKNWGEITESEPSTQSAVNEIELAKIESPIQGFTFEELQVELAKDKEAAETEKKTITETDSVKSKKGK